MKKIFMILCMVLLVTIPAGANPYQSLLDTHMKTDPMLDGYIDQHENLKERYEEDELRFRRMSVFGTDTFVLVNTLIQKNINLLRLDWNLERVEENYLSRKASNEIAFRNSYKQLYDLEKTYQEALVVFEQYDQAYQEAARRYQRGYISHQEYQQSEYERQKAHYDQLAALRNHQAALRNFELMLDRSLKDVTIYTLEEDIMPRESLDTYIQFALENHPDIKERDRTLRELEITVEHINMYRVQVSYQNAKRTYHESVIRLKIENILQMVRKDQLVKRLTQDHEDLDMQLEQIGLLDQQIELRQKQKQQAQRHLSLGYIDQKDVQVYEKAYEKAVLDYQSAVYTYNTQVRQFLYQSAWFMKGAI